MHLTMADVSVLLDGWVAAAARAKVVKESTTATGSRASRLSLRVSRAEEAVARLVMGRTQSALFVRLWMRQAKMIGRVLKRIQRRYDLVSIIISVLKSCAVDLATRLVIIFLVFDPRPRQPFRRCKRRMAAKARAVAKAREASIGATS